MSNITKTIEVTQDNKVRFAVSGISTPLMNKLIETRYVKIEEGSPAGDNIPYELEIRLGGTDAIIATEPMGSIAIQINENGFQSEQEFFLEGYGEQDRSTFISRLSALLDSIDGIVVPE